MKGSSWFVTTGFWSQSHTGHLDLISHFSPYAIRNTGTELSAWANVGATCPLIAENISDPQDVDPAIPVGPNYFGEPNSSVISGSFLCTILTSFVFNSGQCLVGDHSNKPKSGLVLHLKLSKMRCYPTLLARRGKAILVRDWTHDCWLIYPHFGKEIHSHLTYHH